MAINKNSNIRQGLTVWSKSMYENSAEVTVETPNGIAHSRQEWPLAGPGGARSGSMPTTGPWPCANRSGE